MDEDLSSLVITCLGYKDGCFAGGCPGVLGRASPGTRWALFHPARRGRPFQGQACQGTRKSAVLSQDCLQLERIQMGWSLGLEVLPLN